MVQNLNQKLSRIFIALPISDEFSKFILKIQKEFDKKLNNLSIRWTKKENLHITLIPPWYEKDENIGFLKQKLKSFLNGINCFKIKFNLVEYGPNKNLPRLIWIIGENNKKILDLRFNLFKILDKKIENQKFKTHLTIARFNFNPKIKLFNISKDIFWEEEFCQLVLMKSNLLKSGAEYDILEKINFKK